MSNENNISQNKRYFQKQLDNWTNVVSQNMTNLTKPQAVVLTMMSLGMIVAQSCVLTSISDMLSIYLKINNCNIYQTFHCYCYDRPRALLAKTFQANSQTQMASIHAYQCKWNVLSRRLW